MPLKPVRTPELKGLYANSNRFTIPKGSVPRVSNMYMIRRGAFHTIPGTQWLSTSDGQPPHLTDQPPIVDLRWYSPSPGSGAAQLMTNNTPVAGNDYQIGIKQLAGTLEMVNVSAATTEPVATISQIPSGLVNSAQFGDLLFVAFGAGTAPSVFPLYTTVSLAVAANDTTVNVVDTIAFPPTGYIQIDNEVMAYTGITPSQFTGLSRGVLATGASAHAIGAAVQRPTNGAMGATMSLTGAITASQTNFIDFTFSIAPPASGVVLVNQEIFSYTGFILVKPKIGQFQGVQRGTNGTAATFHLQYTPMYPTASLPFPPPSAWNLVVNHFDPSLVYNPWPGVANSGSAGSVVPVNIGTLIFVTDTNQVPWLFRAQNSGVTGFGSNYAGPNFFPSGAGNPGDSIKDHNNSNNSGTVVWLNVGQATLSPPGAAFVFQHLDSLFLWGVGASYGSDGTTGPDALWQSDTGDPQSFNPANTTFVGKGDGTTAQGGAVYSLSEAGIAATPQLVLFKDSSTYAFLNSFASNPSLVPVSGGLGCIAPKSVQFIGGYGVMRLSYMGFTLFDGQLEHVSEYTDAIRGYLFGGLPDVAPLDLNRIQSAVSQQCTNPNMYICYCPTVGSNGLVLRGFAYDFDLKQWTVIDLPFPISSAAFNPQAAFVGSQWQSIIAGLNDSATRRTFFGDPDWDGTPIISSVAFPEMGFPGSPVYVRRVNLRISADGGGATSSLVSAIFNGTRRSGQQFTRPLNRPSSLVSSLDVGEKVLSGAVALTLKGQVLIEGTEAQIDEMPTSRVGT